MKIGYRFSRLSSSTCLKLGAPSWIGSLGSSLWIFSKWSYLSTQTFMGLFCSLLLASSFTFFWYLSLLIHSHLGQSTLQQVILTINTEIRTLPLLLQLNHDGLTGCGRHRFPDLDLSKMIYNWRMWCWLQYHWQLCLLFEVWFNIMTIAFYQCNVRHVSGCFGKERRGPGVRGQELGDGPGMAQTVVGEVATGQILVRAGKGNVFYSRGWTFLICPRT